MREDDIDRAIDDVARELTAGEPDGAFRARVMARIDAGEARGVRFTRWVTSPLPVAALILLALAAAWSYRAYRSPERLALRRDETLAPAPVAPTVRPTGSAKATS